MSEENIVVNFVTQLKIPKKPRVRFVGDDHIVKETSISMGRNDVPVMVKVYDEPEICRGFHENFISHPCVLKYFGETKCSDECCFVYEKYDMSLKDLVKNNIIICTEDNLATYHFREIIKDMCIALEYLHSHKIFHGGLLAENIAIIKPKLEMKVHDKYIVKLMGISNKDSFGKDYQGLADIVKAFMDPSCVEAIHFVKHVKDAEFHQIPLYSLHHNYMSLQDLIVYSPRIILKHPFLWSEDKFVRYLTKVGDLLVVSWGQKDSHPITFASKIGLDNFISHFHIPHGWHRFMPMLCGQNLKNYVEHYGYGEKLLSKLLRFIRDKYVHYCGMNFADQRDFGPPPTTYYMYFQKRFPGLFIHVYNAVERHINKFAFSVNENFMEDEYMLETIAGLLPEEELE